MSTPSRFPVGATVTAHDRRRIAVAALVSPRTVERAYRGDPIRSMVATRILHAARTLGLPAPRVVVAP
jgi:DNA-binding LacI/PurR family transcriptional regulator